jgi:predicted PhzF superfamily epimerase YddE/YHI9
MQVPLFQVDAFTGRLFGGNPAAVCPLQEWLDDAVLQAIARENNLSETAYFVHRGDRYDLRWFTPAMEVDLCGHATLASAHVILNCLPSREDKVVFATRSGELTVCRDGDLLSMDFPVQRAGPCQPHPSLVEALGGKPREILRAAYYLVVYESEEEILALRPKMDLLASLDGVAVIVTAAGKEADFVSRFFAPAYGIPEDPVTGSAHRTLVPYWSKKLGKTRLHARQVSARGGELFCEDRGERVTIAGRAVLYLTGTVYL